MLSNCGKPQSVYIANFTFHNEDKSGVLSFYQDTEYRRVDIFSLTFYAADEELVKTHVAFRLS